MNKVKSIISTLNALALALFLVTGCAAPDDGFVRKTEEELAKMEQFNDSAHRAFRSGNYEQASAVIDKLCKERTVSSPLYQLEKLSILLLEGKQDEAHKLIEKIHQDFETLFNAKLEEKAQSVWHGEVNKVFKGDCYERAAFYALMALSFISKGNYEDALRAVKNGLLADADSNSEKAIDDFALLHYLGFFAASKMNDANEAEAYFNAMKKALQLRGLNADDKNSCFSALPGQKANVLLVVWAGTPPSVVCTGKYKEKRSIIRGQNPFNAMSVAVGGAPHVFTPNNLADIDFQATTRGGRLMDNVLADKATAKAAMEISRNVLYTVGISCLLVGARTLSTPPVGITFLSIGAGCLVVGGTAHLLGYLMNPAADGRYWRNLPGQFYIVPLTLAPGKHRIMLQGYRNFDVAALSFYTVDVPEKEGVSVFHLPMMTQGTRYAAALSAAHREFCNEAVNKAQSNRMMKELK